MSWSSWAAGVLTGIGAPVNPTNFDTLWAWSSAESGADVMRWNNPLNTTLPMFSTGNVDANSVGVKIYPTEGVGVTATVRTLLNGYYPVIVDHLRRSIPRSHWQDACPNLGIWGTGCAWLARTYGAAPGGSSTGGDELTPEEHDALMRINHWLDVPLNPDGSVTLGWGTMMNRLMKAIAAIQPAAGAAITPAQAQALQEAHDAILRVESALKSS